MVPWMETKVSLVGSLSRTAWQKSFCGTFFFPNTIDQNCLLAFTVCFDGATPALEESGANLHSWKNGSLLVLPARESILNVTFSCTLPWRLIKHGLIRCLPPCLNWLSLQPSTGRWCWCEEEQEVPHVAGWQGRFLGKHPVHFSKCTCAALNWRFIWVHLQLGTNQHFCL